MDQPLSLMMLYLRTHTYCDKMTTTIPRNLVLHKFDDIATRLGVFKVDTIGDCYVAVSGSKQKSCYNHGQSID
jgi:hypothetical protein